MKTEMKYIEQKTGFSDNGPVWIGLVRFSKTGSTIYFNGKAFRKGSGISGNHFDIETGDEYWISGVKKNMKDRHSAGGGTIYIEHRVLEDYLQLVEKTHLDNHKYEIIDSIAETTPQHFYEFENEKQKVK